MKDLDRKMTPEWVAAVSDALISMIAISAQGPEWLQDQVMSPDLILEISQGLLWHGVAEWDLFEIMAETQSLEELLEAIAGDLGTISERLEGLEGWE